MKKTILCMMMALGAICTTFAQKVESPDYMKYRNLGFSMTNLELADQTSLKSTYGGSFSTGRTYTINKIAICGFLYLGIDATWMDLSYAQYDMEYKGYSSSEFDQIHQAEAGMQVGPSLTIRPAKNFYIQGYAHFAPTYSAIYSGETIYGGYTSYINLGVGISYRSIGFGIEQRTGECSYSELKTLSTDVESKFAFDGKSTLSNIRAYVSFKF